MPNLSTERVLVTGGTGFIGRHLVRKLLQEGAHVRVLARDIPKAARLFGDEVEIIGGDLRDPYAAPLACRRIDAIYHVGGLYRFGFPYRREMREVNVEGTAHLLDAALKAGVLRFVHVSTSGLLRNRGGLITEKDFPSTPRWGSPYKNSKWEAEKLALAAVSQGLPVVIACPTCPIGEEDDAPTPTGAIFRDFLLGRFRAGTHTGVNVASVDDLVSGLLAVAERGRIGERYILGGENIWLDDLLQRIAQHTTLAAPAFHIPHGVLLAAGAMAELISMPCREWNFPLTLESAIHATRVQFFDTAKARTELGWQPKVPINTAIARAVRWWAEALAERPASVARAPLPRPRVREVGVH